MSEKNQYCIIIEKNHYVCRKCLRQYTAQAEPAAEQKPWKVLSAVCIERHPIITKQLNKVEKQYQKYVETLEIERSYLSDFELEQVKERKKSKEEKKEKETKTKEKKESSYLTTEDKLRLWKTELDGFTPASRTSVADEENDEKSVKRCLDKTLFLIVQKQYNDKSVWCLPNMEWEHGETMRETAERALLHDCGETMNAKVIGNAPVSFYKFVLPPSEDSNGAKTFLFKAVYNKGEVTINDDVKDYKWVTKSELKKLVRRDLYKAVSRSVLDI